MDTQFSLRPATTDDIPQVLSIEKKVFPAPWQEDNFRSELTKPYSHFLVLTDDETDTIVAGYFICWTMFDECQILSLVVDLSYRGLGLAKYMIQKIFALASKKNIRIVALEVRKSNQAAVFLYQKVGFSITHIRKNFYENGEDAYHMTAILDENPDLTRQF